jgi:molybdopterin-guanine dinucleotide biosynthesis protein A
VAESRSAPLRDAITGLVLAGGRGQRMGGLDKGLLPWHGQTLAAHALQRLASQVGRLAVSANRHLDDYRALGAPVWPDRGPDFPGPLAGWQAALHAMDTPWLASVPCDVPGFPSDLVARLGAAAQQAGAVAAYAVAEGRAHPVCALLHGSVREALDEALAARRHRVLDWLHSVQAQPVDFADAAAFANFNRPEDLSPLRVDRDTKR